MMIREGRAYRGFTLVEVLVSLLLLAVVLPVAMDGVSLSLRAAEEAKFKSQASSLARAKLSELQAQNQWDLQKMSGDFGTGYPQYRWTAQLNNFEGSTLEQLDVSVLWRQREREHSVVLSTIITNTTGTTATGSP
jgi:prepilin-type N-terminal cleavage/methylation domain-containing protein